MNKGPRNFNNKPGSDQGYQHQVLAINRVARVVKGGRRLRFRALVVVGDGKGLVGIGCAKGSDVSIAITKAINVAQRDMSKVVMTEHDSIPHDVTAKVGGAHILLKPAKDGTGLIAGSAIRQILEITGYKNIYSKSLGQGSKVNLAYAMMTALRQLVAKENWHLQLASKPKVADSQGEDL